MLRLNYIFFLNFFLKIYLYYYFQNYSCLKKSKNIQFCSEDYSFHYHINILILIILILIKTIRKILQARDIRVSEVDFNPEYIARIIPKLDWTVLWKAAESVRSPSHINIYT